MNNITGELYRKMLIEGALSINDVKETANDLNVFPVPDGDTGTNMALTMSAGLAAMQSLSEPTLKEAVEKTASSLLRGARGNSGVILSLLFRGFSKYLKELETATGRDLALALTSGVETAYSAVMKPAEGTILTVSRVSAAAAVDASENNPEISVSEIFDIVLESAEIALKETQFQNPVLEKAGVFDAGAFGYIEILKGMYNSYLGKEITRSEEQKIVTETETNFGDINTEDIEFGYCTEFIAEKADKRRSAKTLQSILDKIGDSIVVVDDDEIVKVHVHTNEPHIALGEGLKFGPLLSIKIENMREQHSTKVVEEAAAYSKKMEIAPNDNKFGFVSVSAGDGLADVFTDLGVESIVRGGQTMNPSTDDIVRAANLVPAETVFVLPNNKNIIMAAEQAALICETKKIIVIPTKTIPQGITAMLNFDDSSEDANVIAQTMIDSIDLVKSGQITYAARNSDFDGKKIKEGEYLSLFEGKLNSNGKKLDVVTTKLAKSMIDENSQFVTIIFGEESSEEQAQELVSIFEKANPNVEITIINGGQPVYYFLISVE